MKLNNSRKTNHFQQFFKKMHERDPPQIHAPLTSSEYNSLLGLYQKFVCEPTKPPQISSNIEDGLIDVFTITKSDILGYYGVLTKRQQELERIMILIRLKNMNIKCKCDMNTPYEDMVDKYNQHLPIFVKNYLIDHHKDFEEFEKLSNDEKWKKIAIENGKCT